MFFFQGLLIIFGVHIMPKCRKLQQRILRHKTNQPTNQPVCQLAINVSNSIFYFFFDILKAFLVSFDTFIKEARELNFDEKY